MASSFDIEDIDNYLNDLSKLLKSLSKELEEGKLDDGQIYLKSPRFKTYPNRLILTDRIDHMFPRNTSDIKNKKDYINLLEFHVASYAKFYTLWYYEPKTKPEVKVRIMVYQKLFTEYQGRVSSLLIKLYIE